MSTDSQMVNQINSEQYSLFGFQFILLIAVFLVNPMLSSLLVTLWMVSAHWSFSLSSKAFRIIFPAFLGIVNITKEADSDLVGYVDLYLSVSNMSVDEFIGTLRLDPVFQIFQKIVALTFGNNPKWFVFWVVFFGYSILLSAINDISKAVRIPLPVLKCVFIVVVTLPQLFSISSHLIRQFVASAVLCKMFSHYALGGTRFWCFGATSILIHSSTIVFAPLMFLKAPPEGERKSKSLVKLDFRIVIPVLLLGILVATSTDLLTVVSNRVMYGDFYDLEGLSTRSLAFLVLILFVAMPSLILNLDVGWKAKIVPTWLGLIGVTVIVLASEIVFGISELSVRYYMYIYFVGLIYFSALSGRVRIQLLVWSLLALLSFCGFIDVIQNGRWRYASIHEICTGSAFDLWNYRRW
jgi:hypothetical protein